MTDHRFVADVPELHQPTMLVMLTGWIDASEVGAATMQALADESDVSPLVEFDDDAYIDFRARRPVLELRDGVNTSLRWSSISISVGRDRGGHDVVLLAGPEPDMRWHQFVGDDRHTGQGSRDLQDGRPRRLSLRRAAHTPDSPLGDDTVGDHP